MAFALADLRALADELKEVLEIESDKILLSHRLAAAIDHETAAVFGLPSLTDYTLETDVQGVLGHSDFKLMTRWLKNGMAYPATRVGAFIGPKGQERRIPLWMYDALSIEETQERSSDDARHWEALARFRKALDPGVGEQRDSQAARISMSDFLQNLQVSVTDQFSISPTKDGEDFEVVPFSRESDDGSDRGEDQAELHGSDLGQFQKKLRERGALNAFSMGPNRYLVVDRSAVPALKVMAEMQKAPPSERREFIRNPRVKITQAIEKELLRSPEFARSDADVQQEILERHSSPLVVETLEYKEFSERVTGVEAYTGNQLNSFGSSGTAWYSEIFSEALLSQLTAMSPQEMQNLVTSVSEAISTNRDTIAVGDYQLPAREATIELLNQLIAEKASAAKGNEEEEDLEKRQPLILKTLENIEDLNWEAKFTQRSSELGALVPSSLRTRLKDHQVAALHWQVEAWKAGLPGVLNADEQGLGKTLQTISFLVWLNEHMKLAIAKKPILVVAPTSLLRNWEEEVERHVERPGLGHLVRLYGSSTGARRPVGTNGKEIDDATEKLDLSDIANSVARGTGHLTWVLTTYQTLTNYQHSLARIPFAACVFDEIQNIKNPGTLAAQACRAMNADFRIGLTGTPIENATVDLWSIMDQLAAGALGSLAEFKKRYAVPDENNMHALYKRVFKPHNGMPALALRRLKQDVAKDLPRKTRFMHPRLMPEQQALRYDDARIKLASGGMGAALKMLQHIRGVSVHPAIGEPLSHHDFIDASARLTATFDILREVKAKRERALVFIEHRKMQYRFIELVKAELGLPRVDLINGDTPIKQRQEIVNRFQKHLETGPAFDLLVLGPKAAGTGLTLTAATHVIHLSRWWNPAVEEQCNDRVHRIGQKRSVSVHVPMAVHSHLREASFDLLLHSLMQNKRQLAQAALWPMGDSGDETATLHKLLQQESATSGSDPLRSAMLGLFSRDKAEPIAVYDDGSWEYH